jgi:hypothetical protein
MCLVFAGVKTNIKTLCCQAVMYEKDDLQQVLHILNINIKMSTVKIKKVKGFKGSENTEAKNYN